MNTPIETDIDSWECTAFDQHIGHVVDEDFAGAIRVNNTYVFVVGGRPLGAWEYLQGEDTPTVRSVSIDDALVGAAGDVCRAPARTVPLLYTMLATDGETRAQYYSQETPLGETDRALQDGGFTGYIELSENVLSGDYYLLYHGGKRSAVAFVGESRRLHTDEEALELASDEVGIYSVNRARVAPESFPAALFDEADETADIEAPEQEPTEGGDEADQADGLGSEPKESEQRPDRSVPERAGPATDDPPIDIDITPTVRHNPPDDADTTESENADDTDPKFEGLRPEEHESAGNRRSGQSIESDNREEQRQPTPEADATSTLGESSGPTPQKDRTRPEPESSEETAGFAASNRPIERQTDPRSRRPLERISDRSGDAPFTAEIVPAVAPQRTSRADPETTGARASAGCADTESSGESASDAAETQRQQTIEEQNRQMQKLQEALDTAQKRNEELSARVEELEQLVNQTRPDAETTRELTPQQALTGTNLFVRYVSNQQPTLETAADGAAKSEVQENIRIERHTTFDTRDVSIEERSYDGFLTSTQTFLFASYLVNELMFDIRGTQNAAHLSALYKSIPTIDRIDLAADVKIVDSTVEFDLVGRNRHGQPLVVANLEDSREPTDEEFVGSLITDATEVAEHQASLAAAFAVTGAFFQPGAMDVAQKATSSSLLSRVDNKSYVQLSRSNGYHIGLVEGRETRFELALPEL